MNKKIEAVKTKFITPASKEDNPYSFENFIKDDFEAEIYSLLLKRENQKVFGGPIRFLYYFRNSWKTEKIVTDLRIFIKNFRGKITYIENSNSVSDIQFTVIALIKWLEWLALNKREVIEQDFNNDALLTNQYYNKVKYYLQSYLNYLESTDEIEITNFRSFEKLPIKSVLSENTLFEKIEFAKSAIKFLSGNNPANHKPYFSKTQFNLIEKYTIELIRHGKCPANLKLIACPTRVGVTIRYTYFIIHQYIYGKSKQQFFFEFLVSTFSCFSSYKDAVMAGKHAKTKLFKDFSVKPPNYDTDINN